MRPLASAADIHALRMQLNAQQAPPVPAPGPPAPPTAPGPAPTTDIGDPAQATPGPGVPGAQEMLFHLQAISNHTKTPALVQATHAVAKAIAQLQSALHAGQAQAHNPGQTPGPQPGQGQLPGQGQMNFSAADSASPSQLEVRTQADPAKGRGW